MIFFIRSFQCEENEKTTLKLLTDKEGSNEMFQRLKKDRNIHGSNSLIRIQRKWLPNGKDDLSLFSP